jgi:ubiquinone/menaquinone biosynthesis C-methylase UbiE
MAEDHDHLRINAQKWDMRAPTYDKKRFEFMRYMQRRTIKYMPVTKNISFLDIGCGTGWALEYLAELADNQGNFQGIDISPRMIERAGERSLRNNVLKFQVANAGQLPFSEQCFDLILCTNSFHHYRSPQKALSEALRVLKRKGRIYITDFTADGPIGRLIDNRQRRREAAHIRFYSSKQFKSLFADAGFSYIKRRSITPLMMKIHIGEKP